MALAHGGGKKGEAKPDFVKMNKFKESAWKLTVYSTFTAAALLLSVGQPWFTDSRRFWLGCTRVPCPFDVPLAILLFYCAETGFYIQHIHYMLFIETKRKDRLEQMVHHVVTLCLLGYSYYLRVPYVGVMIMLVHDVNDIFLESAKMARYTGHISASEVIFALFFLSWIASRLVVFPFHIIRSTLFDVPEIGRMYGVQIQPHYSILNGALGVLCVLHVYWSYLIGKIVYNALFLKKEVSDVREEDDD